MTIPSKRVTDILVQQGAITREQADQTETLAQHNGKKANTVLTERGWVTPVALAQALGEVLKAPVVDLSKERVQPAALGLIPEDVARQMNVLPLSADAIAQPLFPPMLAQMVRVGEETGNLTPNLEAIADIYEQETDRAISALTGALEPTLTIVMGLVVAFIALSTILPIYSIMSHIR